MTFLLFFAIALAILQVGDAYTTYIILTKYSGYEANKVLAVIFNKIGLVPGLILVKGAVVAASWYMYLMGALPLIIILTALYIWVVGHNVDQIRKAAKQ